ncbi:hypothetical protein HHX47_DHR1001319 [Lentinula edodes]|nr:hypothetical protein HHX47_DHR1001319 [Lentinula edodes]
MHESNTRTSSQSNLSLRPRQIEWKVLSALTVKHTTRRRLVGDISRSSRDLERPRPRHSAISLERSPRI